MYNLDVTKQPYGMDYQLCTYSVLGDRSCSNVEVMEAGGWRKVPASRHPEIRSDDDIWLIFGGQILMERPQYLTQRSREFEQARADAALINAIGSFIDAGDRLTVKGGGKEAKPEPGFVNSVHHVRERSTQRIPNPNAPAIVARGRRKNALEFAIYHGWRGYVWLREKIMGRA